MFPTVTATVTLQHYEPREFDPSKFIIPEDYTKVSATGINCVCVCVCVCVCMLLVYVCMYVVVFVCTERQ